MDIQKTINEIEVEINNVADPVAKVIISRLLNIIEALAKENAELREENQKLRDENNRLKGEQGKSGIRAQTSKSKNISSEKNRNIKKTKKSQKSKKKHKIKIDRTVECKVDKESLPADAVFKGYTTVVVQDIIVITNNIEFKKEVYYSPSLNKTFIADLPAGYHGEFGPNLKSLILTLHFAGKMTEPAIVNFLQTHGTFISAATVSRIITDHHESFHQEKSAIVRAGLESTDYQQMDDTGARVNGKNHYTHVLCNPFYTAYFTRPYKSRLTILEILAQGKITFYFNESSYALMEILGLPVKTIDRLRKYSLPEVMNKIEIETLLNEWFPDPKKTQPKSRRIIMEASAIIAYQNGPYAAKILLTDDAPQFKQITELLALCWIHDGRHYKKLNPAVSLHCSALDAFLDSYWEYYRKLLAYKTLPTPELAKILEQDFNVLFATKTGYDQLDERIEKTKSKKNSLLLVLQYPQLPLHNNDSELGARVQARYRDISMQTKNLKGTESKDTFMTIFETAKKLGVNIYHYVSDRISGRFEMQSLDSLISSQASIGTHDTG